MAVAALEAVARAELLNLQSQNPWQKLRYSALQGSPLSPYPMHEYSTGIIEVSMAQDFLGRQHDFCQTMSS